MKLTRIAALMAAILAGGWPDAAAQSPLLGKQIRVMRSNALPRLRGELIAVSLDSVWLLGNSGLVALPSRDVVSVQVKRRPLGAGGIFAWGMVGGTLSGLALTGACASLEDASCGGVLPGVLLVWALWSGIWASVAGSAYKEYPAEGLQTDIRAFARFPQGLPGGFPPFRPEPADTTGGARRR